MLRPRVKGYPMLCPRLNGLGGHPYATEMTQWRPSQTYEIGEVASQTMTFCASCGKEMQDEWNSCPSCGTTKGGGETVVSAPKIIQQPTPIEIQHPPQDGLITGSYILAAISIIFLPICFGPIAVILAAIASSRGDKRGITALIVAIACTIFGMIAGAVVWSMLEL